MNKALLIIGILCVLVGLGWPWIKNIPFGRLPGDIMVVRENFRFYFPVTTCIVISLILTLLFWIFKK